MMQNAKEMPEIQFASDVAPASFPQKPFPSLDFLKTISYFADVEEKCDLAIQKQDALIRSVSARMRGKADATGQDDAFLPLTADQASRSHLTAVDLPFSEYRKIAAMANTHVGPMMPMATLRFISQAGSAEVDEIEALEIEIQEHRKMMQQLEDIILEQTPAFSYEATAKLKFMTGLMLDGGEIEVDLFAYIVAECAQVIDSEMAVENILRQI